MNLKYLNLKYLFNVVLVYEVKLYYTFRKLWQADGLIDGPEERLVIGKFISDNQSIEDPRMLRLISAGYSPEEL